MGLYQKEKINPFSSFLPLLIQLPILIALYQVFWKGFEPGQLSNLYSFIPHPGEITPLFLGIVNLGKPSWIMAVLVGVLQFFQTKMLTPKISKDKKQDKTAQFSDMMQKQMLYFFPIFFVLILLKLPAALSLYLIITTLFTIFQQYLITGKFFSKNV